MRTLAGLFFLPPPATAWAQETRPPVLEDPPSLVAAQKREIFYYNDARFLRLDGAR
jgi:hypothetical protein